MAIDVDSVYAGDSMNAAYVKSEFGGSRVLTIGHVSVKVFGGEGEEKEKKVQLHFKGEEKVLALNVTNKNICKDAWGSDAEKWIGKSLRVYKGRTTYKGDVVDCVSVEPQGGTPADMPPASASPNLTQKAMAWQQIKTRYGGDAGKAAPVFKAAFDAVGKGKPETQFTESDWAAVALWDPAVAEAELPPF